MTNTMRKNLSMWTDKKGVFEQLSSIALGLGSFAVILVVVILILANVRSNGTVSSNVNATAAVDTTINQVATLPGWLGIIIVVAVGALLLSMIYIFRRAGGGE